MLCIFPILLGLCALVSARCGTPQPNESIKALHAAYQAHEAASAKQPARRQAGYAINTYINVIVSGVSEDEGNIPQSWIDNQLDVLNQAYSNTGFTFNLIDVVYILNASWRQIQYASDTEYAMKSELRRGNYNDLNVYLDTIAPTPQGDQLLGYATFPDQANQRTFNLDGVVVDPGTLPGGSLSPYNLGITLVHEVGHWLSLFHTFEAHGNNTETGGCYGSGDYIFDTPAEGSFASDCPTDRDTCTGSVQDDNDTSEPGADPVHNYMDYTNDSCLTQFTQGQIDRMVTSYSDTRLVYVQGNGGEETDDPVGNGPHGG